DCDDADADARPGQAWYADCDADGAFTGHAIVACAEPPSACADAISPAGGWSHVTPTSPDCDDDDAQRKPGQVWFADCDGDGSFAPTGHPACAPPVGACGGAEPEGGWTDEVPGAADCDDADAGLHPGQR